MTTPISMGDTEPKTGEAPSLPVSHQSLETHPPQHPSKDDYIVTDQGLLSCVITVCSSA